MPPDPPSYHYPTANILDAVDFSAAPADLVEQLVELRLDHRAQLQLAARLEDHAAAIRAHVSTR